MKRLIVAVCAGGLGGLFAGCECCDNDLYRCAYERPRVFCWEDYDEYEKCEKEVCNYRCYPIYAEKAYIRVYKGPVYYGYPKPRDP